MGTTSACAENTFSNAGALTIQRNYLRVRGEYKARKTSGMNRGELPPRARRILLNKLPIQIKNGTTSACAENTPKAAVTVLALRNYLRVRGEYWLMRLFLSLGLELPPRARRIP